MNWRYDKVKIVSLIVAIIIVFGGGTVGGDFLIDNQTDAKIALSETATSTQIAELSDDITALEEAAITPADLAAIEAKIIALRAELVLLIAADNEDIAGLQDDILGILDQLDDIEDDVAVMWEDLYDTKGLLYQVDWLWDHRYDWHY